MNDIPAREFLMVFPKNCKMMVRCGSAEDIGEFVLRTYDLQAAIRFLEFVRDIADEPGANKTLWGYDDQNQFLVVRIK